MKKYDFPTYEDRLSAHNFIIHQRDGKCSRDDMMKLVGHLIQKYGVTRMPIFDYSVKILKWWGDVPVISIEGAQFSDDCPVCKKETEVGYLRTDKENFDKSYDIVIVNCLDCGCLFATKGHNGRTIDIENWR